MLAGWETVSVLALTYPILFTSAKTGSRASSESYPSFLGHIIQSGSMIQVAISVSLLVFVLTRLKLTLGYLVALQSHCLLEALCDMDLPYSWGNHCHSHPNERWDLISCISYSSECLQS